MSSQILTPTTANDDLSLPKATVQKIVSEILPPSQGIAFNKDARDLLIECCVEFITLISSEANEISEKESKKTIACEHITKALEQLGFGDYVPGINEVAGEFKEAVKVSDFIWAMFKTLHMASISLAGARMEMKRREGVYEMNRG